MINQANRIVDINIFYLLVYFTVCFGALAIKETNLALCGHF